MLVLDYRIFADIKNFYFYPENPPFSSGVEEPKVNIYFAKLGSLDSLEELKKQIKNSQANLILLKNYNPTISLALIQTLKTTEQINVLHYKKHDFDLLIFSQLDLEDIQQNFDQEQELPNYLIAKIRLNQTITTNFIFFNALSPLIESNFHNNKAYCRRLATVVKNSQEPQIVVGSFLATPHSLCYNWFTAKERTKDVLWGKGFVKTWKVNNPLLNLKLDHIFYNSFWRLTNSASLPSLDQVHFPQSASFTFDQSFSNSALGNSDKS